MAEIIYLTPNSINPSKMNSAAAAANKVEYSPCFINRYIHIVITQTTIVLSKFPITVLNILISTALPNDTPPFKNRQTEMKKTAIVATESEIEDNTVPMLSSNAFLRHQLQHPSNKQPELQSKQAQPTPLCDTTSFPCTPLDRKQNLPEA